MDVPQIAYAVFWVCLPGRLYPTFFFVQVKLYYLCKAFHVER